MIPNYKMYLNIEIYLFLKQHRFLSGLRSETKILSGFKEVFLKKILQLLDLEYFRNGQQPHCYTIVNAQGTITLLKISFSSVFTFVF